MGEAPASPVGRYHCGGYTCCGACESAGDCFLTEPHLVGGDNGAPEPHGRRWSGLIADGRDERGPVMPHGGIWWAWHGL